MPEFKESKLFKAIETGIVDDVVSLLAGGGEEIDLTARDESGRSYLHAAIDMGTSPDILTALLKHNVDITARDEKGDSIIDRIDIEGNSSDVIESVIRDHIESMLNSGDVTGVKRLILAGWKIPLPSEEKRQQIKEKSAIVDKMLEQIEDFQHKIKEIRHLAEAGEADKLAAMADQSSDLLTAADVTGFTALHAAVVNGHAELVKLILEKCPAALELKDNMNRSALHYAACLPDDGAIYQTLLEARARDDLIDCLGNDAKTYKDNTEKLLIEDVRQWVSRLKTKELKHLSSRPSSTKDETEAGDENTDNVQDVEDPRPDSVDLKASRPSTTKSEKSGATFSSIARTESAPLTEIRNDPYREKAEPPTTFDACYLADTLGSVLTEALAEIANRRPWDPIDYLAGWLYKYAENRDYAKQAARTSEEVENAVKDAEIDEEFVTKCKEELTSQRETDAELERQRLSEIAEQADVTCEVVDDVRPGSLPTVIEEAGETVEAEVNVRDKKGETALHRAAADPDVDLVELLEQGYALSIKNVLNQTARDIAADKHIQKHIDSIDDYVCKMFETGNTGEIEKLLLAGYKPWPDIVAKYGPEGEGLNKDAFEFYTKIADLKEKIAQAHQAVIDGDLRLLQQQLDRKALAGATDVKGLTLLHSAILNKKQDIVEYLVQNFPFLVDVCDAANRAPLHYAGDAGEEFANILKENGAKDPGPEPVSQFSTVVVDTAPPIDDATGDDNGKPEIAPPSTKYEKLNEVMDKYGMPTLKDEIYSVTSTFEKYDLDGDGKITRAELEEYCQKANWHPKRVEAMFKKYDSDEDGSISMLEFIQGTVYNHIYEAWDAKFDEFITDPDRGGLDKEEIQTLLADIGFDGDRTQAANEFFDQFDDAATSGYNDGVITFDEFVKYLDKELDDAFNAAFDK